MYNRILTPACITDYAASLQKEERATATAEKYLHDIRAFAAWLNGVPADQDAAVRWRDSLLAKGLSPTTVNAKLSAVNGLFRFLGWENCRVKHLKIQHRAFRDPARELSLADYQRLLDAAHKRGQARLTLLLETICATGVRVSEVRFITVEAVRRGRADVALKGKIRTILLPGKLCRKLLKYAGKQKTASGEIFLTRGGNSLSRKQIWREMKGLCETAGVEPSKVFPHNLRHLFAVTFYRATRDIAKLADLLGHNSIDTTRIYLMTTGVEHARQLERLGLIS